MKRHYFWLVAVISCGLFISGLAQAKTTIEYWYGDHNESYYQVIQDVVNKYNESQNEVEVTLMTAKAGAAFEEKLLASLIGGVAPDLVHFEGSAVIEWQANTQTFAPLDPYLISAGVKKDDFLPQEWQEGSLWGQQYSIPFRTASRGLFWNRDIFAEVGLNDLQGPATVDELDDMARKITQKGQDGKLTRLGFAPWLNNWNLQGWFWAFGGGVFDWENMKFTINTPENAKALRWVKEYADQYGTEAVNFGRGYSGQNERFLLEDLGMILQSTTYVARIETYRPDLNYWVGLPPSAGGNGNWGGGFSHVIPVTSQHKEEAAQFAAYLASPAVQLQFYQATGLLPTRWEAVRRLMEVTDDPRTLVMIQGLPEANARTPYWLTIHRNLNRAQGDLINGRKTVEAILLEHQLLADETAKNLVH